MVEPCEGLHSCQSYFQAPHVLGCQQTGFHPHFCSRSFFFLSFFSFLFFLFSFLHALCFVLCLLLVAHFRIQILNARDTRNRTIMCSSATVWQPTVISINITVAKFITFFFFFDNSNKMPRTFSLLWKK